MATYGAKYGRGGPLRAAGHSGFTPIPADFPGQNFPFRREIEGYQKSKFLGFTTSELADLDIISERSLKPSDLNNPILPMFRKQKWQASNNPHYPGQFARLSHQSRFGKITGHNLQVWAALKPVLRLATLILNSAHMLPFDALLLGRRSKINKSRIPPQTPANATSGAVWDPDDFYDGWPLESFTKRPRASTPAHFAEAQVARDAVFGQLNRHIRMRLKDVTDDEKGDKVNGSHGLTTPADRRITIYLNIKDIVILLKSSSNDAEKSSTQWFLAETLVHETMHAINFLRQYEPNPPPIMHEPYYQNNIFTELGYEMSQAVFGGVGEAAVPGYEDYRTYFFFWLQTNYPNIVWITARSPNPVLTYPNPVLEALRYPIPISFFENIFQTAFWESGVRRLGMDILHADTTKYGSRATIKRKGDRRRYDYDFTLRRVRDMIVDENRSWLSKTERVARLDSIMNFNPDERKAVLFGQSLSQYNGLVSDYRNLARLLQRAVWDINAHILNPLLPGPLNTGYDQIMMQDLEKACAAHADMISKTLNMEQPTPPGNLPPTSKYPGDAVPVQAPVPPLPPDAQVARTEFIHRRASLLDWNRAMRRYLQILHEQYQPRYPILGQRLHDLRFVRLEHCRMQLYVPGENDAAYAQEAQEMAQIDTAYTNVHDQAQNHLAEISTAHSNFADVDDAAAFTYYALTAVRAATPPAWGLSKDRRLADADEVIAPLSALHTTVVAQAWKDKVKQFHDLAVGARTRILMEP
ncbi:hypothetical protein B7494_g1969 [Chlorociboria aeruginascens]|nr:hypothetical protein B7494_g1969 [Chlorociboria aeruginascens]